MELNGKIKLINQQQTFGDSGFRKRDMVITTDEQYPQMIQIEFIQDNVDLLDKFTVGQDVKVGINIRGREWINPEGIAKYFNAIQGWNISETKHETPSQPQPTNAGSDNSLTDVPDDLPF